MSVRVNWDTLPTVRLRRAPTPRQLRQERAAKNVGAGMAYSDTMRIVVIRAGASKVDRLATIAQARGTSLAAIMREALDLYLAQKGNGNGNASR